MYYYLFHRSFSSVRNPKTLLWKFGVIFFQLLIRINNNHKKDIMDSRQNQLRLNSGISERNSLFKLSITGCCWHMQSQSLISNWLNNTLSIIILKQEYSLFPILNKETPKYNVTRSRLCLNGCSRPSFRSQYICEVSF